MSDRFRDEGDGFTSTRDGRFCVISATTDKTTSLRVWDLETRQAVFQGKGVGLFVRTIGRSGGLFALSPDGRTIAIGNEDDLQKPLTIQIWDIPTGGVRTTLSVTDGFRFNQLLFSADGKVLVGHSEGASSEKAPSLWFWEMPSGRLIASHGGIRLSWDFPNSFTSAGQVLASLEYIDKKVPGLGQSVVALHDLSTGRRRGSIPLFHVPFFRSSYDVGPRLSPQGDKIAIIRPGPNTFTRVIAFFGRFRGAISTLGHLASWKPDSQ
jgi:WD40 repeat protein